MSCRHGLVLAIFATFAWNPSGGIAQDARGMAPEAREYLEYALRIMESDALNRHKVDWAEVRAIAYRQAAAAQYPRDTYRAIADALAALQDNHSRFIPPRSELPEMLRTVLPASGREPEGRRLGERVAYIAIPGFSGPGTASRILQILFELDGPEVCGWIVDLRGNTGGNMWPMLQGLSPILGDEVPGYFVTGEGKWTAWRIETNLAVGQRLMREQVAAAILQDGRTVSSGEAVVVAFRGRPGTRSFGQSTRGLSTANRTIAMPDGALLNLTVAVFADRNRNLYGHAIEPEEFIPAETPDSQVLQAAREWLVGQPACSH
jgi:carboxyl-terminal processing protease